MRDAFLFAAKWPSSSSMRPLARFAILATTVTVLATSVPADAGHRSRGLVAHFPLLDRLEVLVRSRDVLAIDGRFGGAVVRERLAPREEVLWAGARGAVGVVVTDRRVLAATVGSSRWSETDIRVHESLPSAVYLGDRVALVLTDRRVIGIAAMARRRFFEDELGVNETLVDVLVGENVALVLTDRRALGLSGFLSGFFEQAVSLHERIDDIAALADFATVATHRRLLVFNAPSGSWQERRLSLR